MDHTLTLTHTGISKRVLAAVAALALAIAAPAAIAASTSGSPGVIHTFVQKSGTIVVSGYDGGAPLAPSTP